MDMRSPHISRFRFVFAVYLLKMAAAIVSDRLLRGCYRNAQANKCRCGGELHAFGYAHKSCGFAEFYGGPHKIEASKALPTVLIATVIVTGSTVLIVTGTVTVSVRLHS